MKTICKLLGFVFFLFLSGHWVWSQNKQTAFQIQQFRPWLDPDGMFQTQSGKTLGQPWKFFVGTFLNYSKDVLTFRFPDDRPRLSVLSHQLGLDFISGVAVLKWLDIRLKIPMTLYQSGTIPNDPLFGASSLQSLSGYGFGDVQLAVKAQALHQSKHFLDLAFQIQLGLPSGNTNNMNGEDGVSFSFEVFASRTFVKKWVLALNFGYRYMPLTEIANLTIWHEFFYKLGASFRVIPKTLDIIGEIAGSTSLTAASLQNAPFDGYVGVRYYLPWLRRSLSLYGGLGLGIFPAYGSPQFRILTGLSWNVSFGDQDKDKVLDFIDRCPDIKGDKANHGCPSKDTDGDGIPDHLDKCPKVKGDKTNHGCPLQDTDGDGIPDSLDKCPKVKGDKANHGCPLQDTDGDGVPDSLDKCPKVKGDKTNHGCPIKDTDGDGVSDKEDLCPNQKGDPLFKGCPDPNADTDGDGIKDQFDKCPTVKGTIEYLGCLPPQKDTDGDGVLDHLDACPFLSGTVKGCPSLRYLKGTQKGLSFLKPIDFVSSRSSRISKRSGAVITELAKLLKKHPKVKAQIEGHYDNSLPNEKSKSLTLARAQNLLKELVRKGVPKAQLKAVGWGGNKPAFPNFSRRGRKKNQRMEIVLLPLPSAP